MKKTNRPHTGPSGRRNLLGAAAAVAAAGMTASLGAQEPRVKGPAVWLDMDQAALDAAYDQSQYAPNQPQVTKRFATNSDAARARLGPPRRFPYGPAEIEGLD